MSTSLSSVEEGALVEKLWNQHSTLTLGSSYYVFPFCWFQSWCCYTGFNSITLKLQQENAKGDKPQNIDCKPLLDEQYEQWGILKHDIMENLDYFLVPAPVAELFATWYPLSHSIIRYVIESGSFRKKLSVNVHPLVVRRQVWGVAEWQLVNIDRKLKWKDIAEQWSTLLFKQSGDVSPPEVRLWVGKTESELEDERKRRVFITPPPPPAENDTPTPAYQVHPTEYEDITPSRRLVDEFRLMNDTEMGQTPELMGIKQTTLILIEAKELVTSSPSEMSDATSSWIWPRHAYEKRWDDFEVGDQLDVLDSVKKWILASVVRMSATHIYVHYTGWAAKWDEWVAKTDTTRLQPLYTYTPRPHIVSSTPSYGGMYSYGGNREGTPDAPGAVGCANLGNTCFMNSIIACLAHCTPLTDFFLDDLYLKDLNRTNPIGFHGKVAEEYGSLIKQIFSGQYQVVSPREFKTVIGEFAPRFSGYQQQDSAELLGFLLDGIHEDLNRVLKKPATQSIDSNGRPDVIVAQESWNNHLMRNQSVVVDELQGQLKSTVVCPIAECSKVSVTFDPFTFFCVPLPTINDTIQTVHLVYADLSRPVTLVSAVVSKVARMPELRDAIGKAVGDIANTRTLIVTEVWNSKIHKFFSDEESVSDIRSNDVIYVFEKPELESYRSDKDYVIVPILFQTTSMSTYEPYRYSSYNSYGSSIQSTPNPSVPTVHYRYTEIGVPRLMVCPKHTHMTLAQVQAQLANVMHNVAKPVDSASQSAAAQQVKYLIQEDETGFYHSYNRKDPVELVDYVKQESKPEGATSFSTSTALVTTSTFTDYLPNPANVPSPLSVTSTSPNSSSLSPEPDDVIPNTTTSPSPDQDISMETVSIQSNQETSNSSGDDYVKVEQNDSMDTASSPVGAHADLNSPLIVPSKPHSNKPLALFIIRFPLPPSASTPSPDDESPKAASPSAVIVLPDSSSSSSLSDNSVVPSSPTPSPSLTYYDYDVDRSAHGIVRHSSVNAAESSLDKMDAVSIYDCFRAFTKEEILSEQEMWYCRNCKEHRQASKQMNLWKLPNILIIQIKRFSYNKYSRDKINTYVDFPLFGLKMGEFTANPQHSNDVYDLFATSQHMGGLGGGHYNAYVRNMSNGRWYLHDDSHVSAARPHDVKSSAAYVLFYKRRGATLSEVDVAAIREYEEQEQRRQGATAQNNSQRGNPFSNTLSSSSMAASDLDLD